MTPRQYSHSQSSRGRLLLLLSRGVNSQSVVVHECGAQEGGKRRGREILKIDDENKAERLGEKFSSQIYIRHQWHPRSRLQRPALRLGTGITARVAFSAAGASPSWSHTALHQTLFHFFRGQRAKLFLQEKKKKSRWRENKRRVCGRAHHMESPMCWHAVPVCGRAVPRLPNALFLQWFLFSVKSGCFCEREKKKKSLGEKDQYSL